MCEKMGIRIIAASSPQAKGRVERVHGTHQDRLVKELRLATVGNVPRRDNWTTCSGWRKNECSVKTGWCVTKTACCNSRGKIVTGRRLRAECGCGRTSQDTSSFTIADRACRFAKFPWLLLRRGAGDVDAFAHPKPGPPHPPALTRNRH